MSKGADGFLCVARGRGQGMDVHGLETQLGGRRGWEMAGRWLMTAREYRTEQRGRMLTRDRRDGRKARSRARSV